MYYCICTMRSNSIILLFILVFTRCLAQNGPDVILSDTIKPLYNKVMIIPFEENMYLCGVQTHLAQESRKTHNEIVHFFRESTVLELQNQFLYRYNTVSLLHYNDTSRDLFKAYDAVSYKFEVIEVESEGDLPPPDEDEQEILEIYAEGNPKARLACQVCVTCDVHIRPLDE